MAIPENMKNQYTPYIFLGILMTVFVFILGLRYGQKVEKDNKVINYLISLPPTKSVPTNIPLEFKTYENKNCHIKFLYPSKLIINNIGSNSAELTEKKEIAIKFSCQLKNDLIPLLENKKLATQEIKLGERKILARISKQNNNNLLVFAVQSPKTGQKIYLMVETRLYPLFDKSLEFAYE